MSPEFPVVRGPYLQDLLSQPTALEDTLAGLKPVPALDALALNLTRNGFQRVLLTGMGSSFYALHPLNLALVDHGVTSWMLETSELIHYQSSLLGSKTLVVAASQSGESVETVRLLEINRRRSPLIGITNSPGSSLAKSADAVVLTAAGTEFTVSCKTYVATLMALEWLGTVLCGEDLAKVCCELKLAAPTLDGYMRKWEQHVEELSSLLHAARQLFLVGRGSSLAAVGTGGLIVKESTHFPTEGLSSAAFRHGPMEMLSEETFVLVFSGDSRTAGLNQRLAQDVLKCRASAGLVSENASKACFQLPDGPARLRPILEILPVQMITLALAARAGREAGRFERASKVTLSE